MYVSVGKCKYNTQATKFYGKFSLSCDEIIYVKKFETG